MNDIADELAEYGLNSTFRELCVLFTDLNLNLGGKLNTEEYKENEEYQPANNNEETDEDAPDQEDKAENHSKISKSHKSHVSEAEAELNSKRSLRSKQESHVSKN
jgi:hypothetical protein